jgi:hypothetical protein
MPPLLRRFPAELVGRRHTVVERDRFKVEPARPGQRSKLDENAREERRVLQRMISPSPRLTSAFAPE